MAQDSKYSKRDWWIDFGMSLGMAIVFVLIALIAGFVWIALMHAKQGWD